MSEIREEFEKAFRSEKVRRHKYSCPVDPFDLESAALWAATWMANKIIESMKQREASRDYWIPEIRALAAQLKGEK